MNHGGRGGGECGCGGRSVGGRKGGEGGGSRVTDGERSGA